MFLSLGRWKGHFPQGFSTAAHMISSYSLTWVAGGGGLQPPKKKTLLAKNKIKSRGEGCGVSCNPDLVLLGDPTKCQASPVHEHQASPHLVTGARQSPQYPFIPKEERLPSFSFYFWGWLGRCRERRSPQNQTLDKPPQTFFSLEGPPSLMS